LRDANIYAARWNERGHLVLCGRGHFWRWWWWSNRLHCFETFPR